MAKPSVSRQQRRSFSGRPLIEQVKDLFSLHKGERRGTAAMMVVLLALLAAVVHQQWLKPPERKDVSALREEMQAWLAQRESAQQGPGGTIGVETELFPFDPNAISEEEWQRLGLTARQAAAIERYRAKGGRFRIKRDLGRMYTIKPELYERWEPFIQLPDSLPKKQVRVDQRGEGGNGAISTAEPRRMHADDGPAARAKRPGARQEVNAADTAALIALPGIGPAFARGIVKYRESLGGYHSLDQLAEVHVLKDKPDAVARLKELLVVDTLAIRRIPINTCTAEELAAHPYARWRIAKPVVAYRQQHGSFKRIEDLRVIPVIDEEGFRKLAPYLTLE